MFRPSALHLLFPVMLALPLAGCEQLGIETPAQTVARQEAEGKAIGGACRHAGHALEDCYRASPKTSKAAIYTGWRDMDTYMRENKLDVVMPVREREAAKPAPQAEEDESTESGKAEPSVEKSKEEASAPALPKGGKSKQS